MRRKQNDNDTKQNENEMSLPRILVTLRIFDYSINYGHRYFNYGHVIRFMCTTTERSFDSIKK